MRSGRTASKTLCTFRLRAADACSSFLVHWEVTYIKADLLHKVGQHETTDGIDFVMDKFKLDALVAPTGGPAWLTDLINGDHSSGGSSNTAAVAGYPNINVTGGFLYGLPVGISFFGRAWSEPALLKIAYAFEQLTKARQKPMFLPSIPLAV